MTDGHQLDPESLGDHVDRLYRAAWSLCGSREEAEDLVQETFVRVLLKPRWLHAEDDIGYLLRVLRNTFVSGRRTAARRPLTNPLPDDLTTVEDRCRAKPRGSRSKSPSSMRRSRHCPRVPRRADRRRRRRAQLPRGGARAAGARGDADDAGAPCAWTGRRRAQARRRAGGPSIERAAAQSDEASFRDASRQSRGAEIPAADSTHVWPRSSQTTTVRPCSQCDA